MNPNNPGPWRKTPETPPEMWGGQPSPANPSPSGAGPSPLPRPHTKTCDSSPPPTMDPSPPPSPGPAPPPFAEPVSDRLLPYPTRTFQEAYDLGERLGSGTYGAVWLCTLKVPLSAGSSHSASPSGPPPLATRETSGSCPSTGKPPRPRNFLERSVSGVMGQRKAKDQDRGSSACAPRRTLSRSTSTVAATATVHPKQEQRSSTERKTSRNEAQIAKSSSAKDPSQRFVGTANAAVVSRFACKMVPKSALATKAKQDDLRREIAILKAFSGAHDGIVRLHDVMENPKSISLVMEYCNGGDLFELLCRSGPLPEPAARFLFRQVAAAVAFCHEHGVMHRDIKPENILFKAEGGACPKDLYSMKEGDASHPPGISTKLADFGLSAVMGRQSVVAGYSGSRYYTAPEMVRGWTYGMRADVWSLGVVLVVMLTGRLPFAGRTDADLEGIKRAILAARMDFNQPPWDVVSEDVKDLVKGMLQVDPMKRLHAREVLVHPWLAGNQEAQEEKERPRHHRQRVPVFPLFCRRKRDSSESSHKPAECEPGPLPWHLQLTCSSLESEASCISQRTLEADSPSPVVKKVHELKGNR